MYLYFYLALIYLVTVDNMMISSQAGTTAAATPPMPFCKFPMCIYIYLTLLSARRRVLWLAFHRHQKSCFYSALLFWLLPLAT